MINGHVRRDGVIASVLVGVEGLFICMFLVRSVSCCVVCILLRLIGCCGVIYRVLVCFLVYVGVFLNV